MRAPYIRELGRLACRNMVKVPELRPVEQLLARLRTGL